jgi:hypothetical protein
MIINRGYDLDPAVERLYNTYLELQMNAQEGMDEVLAKVCSSCYEYSRLQSNWNWLVHRGLGSVHIASWFSKIFVAKVVC